MRIILAFGGLCFLAGLFELHGQPSPSKEDSGTPVLIKSPAIEIPEAVRKSGLGGRVRVRVAIDKEGNVRSVEDVLGPDAVCPQVEDADVLAMRNASREAAVLAKFVPAKSKEKSKASQTWLDFNFPRTPVKGTSEPTTSDGRTTSLPVTADSAREAMRSGVINGRALSLPKPPYPPAARPVRASGTVTVKIIIDENGNVFSAEAVSGHALLRPSAESAACRAKFTKTKLDGMALRIPGFLTYGFVP